MRFGYVIQSFKNPDQLRRLTGVLRRGSPGCTIVISHSGQVEDLQELVTEGLTDVVLKGRGGRGRFSLVEDYVDCLAWLAERGMDPDWVIHMSGQDYPVASLSRLQAFLRATKHDGFFEHFEAFDRSRLPSHITGWTEAEARDRYLFQYSHLTPETSRLVRAVLRIPRAILARSDFARISTSYGIQVGIRPRKTPFVDGFKCYGGSFWQIVNRRCVARMLEQFRNNHDLKAYYQQVILPDESYLQTILLNDETLSISPFNLRYIRYGEVGHGAVTTLTLTDLPRFEDRGYFFARKFDIGLTPEIFDRLDALAIPETVAHDESEYVSSWRLAAE